MSWLNRIGRALEPFAIPHLTLVLVAGQLCMLVASQFLNLLDLNTAVLVPSLAMQGEWWRLVTFAFVPPPFHAIWSAFALYMIYLFGSALENYWGNLRFNLFLLCGYVLTIGVAFITPNAMATNLFISGALFLAFAYLNPDFEIMVFFILPVKIKWLALITWLGYAYMFFTGGLAAKLSIVAAVGNFLIFFSRDLWRSARTGRRHMKKQADRIALQADTPRMRNRCYVCGKTSATHPHEDFRFCSKCEGDCCYCSEHLRNHEHVRASGPSVSTSSGEK